MEFRRFFVSFALACVLPVFAPTAFAQGTILFNNYIPETVNAPVYRPDGTGAGAGWNAQLALVNPGGSSPTYTVLSPATTFRTTGPAAAPYVEPTQVIVPNIPAGAQATLVMRAWEGPGSYESATVRGQSAPITIILGGLPQDGGAPIPDALLVGLQAIPEPGTTVLIMLGAAGLLFRRYHSGPSNL